MHGPSDRDVNWMSPMQGKSPSVQVKEPYSNLDMVTCRLSPCNPGCTKYSKKGLAVYRERKNNKLTLHGERYVVTSHRHRY